MKHLCYKCGEKATKLCDFRNYKKDTIVFSGEVYNLDTESDVNNFLIYCI